MDNEEWRQCSVEARQGLDTFQHSERQPMSYTPHHDEEPSWAQRLIVAPSLLRIEIGIWVAPQRQRWSVDAASFDHRQERQLSLFVGRERHGLKLAEVKHAMITHLVSEWNSYASLEGPFGPDSPVD